MKALAGILMRAAVRLSGTDGDEWARAMRAEFQHVSERDRLPWAFGCVIAAIRQRWTAMTTGDLRVSRLVMLVETLGCFGFLSLGWYVITLGPAGLAHLNGELIEKAFFGYAGGPYIFWMMAASAIVWLVGPIGLILGLRYAMQGRALSNRTFGWSLIGATIALSVLGTIAGAFVGPADFHVEPGLILLMTVMPVAGILHLMYLAQPAATPRMPAAA
jgi:hypothetical protein